MPLCLLIPLMPSDKIIRDGVCFLLQFLPVYCVSLLDALRVNGSSEGGHGMNHMTTYF